MDKSYQDKRRIILFDPETGYYNLPAKEQAGRAKEVFQSLRAGAATLFADTTSESLSRDGNDLFKIDGSAQDTVAEEISLARSQAAKETAAREYINPETLNQTLAIVTTEAIDSAEADGYPIDSLYTLNRIVIEQSNLMRGAILAAIAGSDITHARNLYIEYIDILNANDSAFLDATIDQAEEGIIIKEEKAERTRIRELKIFQEDNYSDTLGRLAKNDGSNQDVTLEDIEWLRNTNRINASQFKTVNDILRKQAGTFNNPELFNDLRVRIYGKDINKATLLFYRDQITEKELTDLVDLYDRVTRRPPITATQEIARVRIFENVTGERDPFAVLKPNVQRDLDRAMVEFYERVASGTESLTDIEKDIIETYTNRAVVSDLSELPIPRTWMGTFAGSKEQLNKRWTAAYKKLNLDTGIHYRRTEELKLLDKIWNIINPKVLLQLELEVK